MIRSEQGGVELQKVPSTRRATRSSLSGRVVRELKVEDILPIPAIVLNNVVKNNKKIIISTGGGTPCFFRNIELMNDFGITIYLKKDPNKLYNLLVKSKKRRPVFESFKNKDEFFNNFKHREQFYLKSKIIIDCDSISNKEIILKINHILNENRFEK